MTNMPDDRPAQERLPMRLGQRVFWGAISLFAGILFLGDAWEAAQRDDVPRAIAYSLVGCLLLLYGIWWAFAPGAWVEDQRSAMRQPVPLRRVLMVIVTLILVLAAVFWYVPDSHQGMLLLLFVVVMIGWEEIPKFCRWLARRRKSHQDANSARA